MDNDIQRVLECCIENSFIFTDISIISFSNQLQLINMQDIFKYLVIDMTEKVTSSDCMKSWKQVDSSVQLQDILNEKL